MVYEFIFYPLIGFFIAIIVGMTGVAAGLLGTPLMILAGLPTVSAVGVNLLWDVIMRAFGSFLHHKAANVDWRISKLLIMGGVPGVVGGGAVLFYVKSAYGDELLNFGLRIFIIILVSALASLELLRQRKSSKKVSADNPSPEEKEEPINTRGSKFKFLCTGALPGFTVATTSIGSGSVLLPLLLRLMKNPHKMVGIALFFGLVMTGVSSFFHFGLGSIDYLVVGLLLAGSIPGTFLGVKLNKKVSAAKLRRILVIIIFVAVAMLILKTFYLH